MQQPILYRIELFGGISVTCGAERHTRFRTRKTAELLAYLAYYRRNPHPRELLADLLWPECAIDAGRHNLSMALSSLRQQIEPKEQQDEFNLILVDRYAVSLNSRIVSIDTAEFDTLLACADREPARAAQLRSKAVELYAGDLLSGCYEDWVFPEQQRLAEQYFLTLHQLARHFEGAHDYTRALQFALRALKHDRRHEETHRLLMRLHAHAGQIASALRQFQDLSDLCRCDGYEPEAETVRLAEAIRARSFMPEGQPQPDASDQLVETPLASRASFEPAGGAVPLQSRFYIERRADSQFAEAIARRDSIVLAKGARQVGKTSLLARGLHQARNSGCTILSTHLQSLNEAHFASAETLLMALAEMIAEQLDLPASPSESWETRRGANPNFRRFLRRQVFPAVSGHIVWGMDEIDRLLPLPFRGEIFGLFRSWHDERALDPAGPWSGLTLALVYSTEAHLLIPDTNQSPFNVGTIVSMEDFDLEQIADLNLRHGSPLKCSQQVRKFIEIVGGQPHLVRLGLYAMATLGIDVMELERQCLRDDWIIADHLRRIQSMAERDASLAEAVKRLLRGEPVADRDSFYRLRSAGIVTGDSVASAAFRCGLYADYLKTHLS